MSKGRVHKLWIAGLTILLLQAVATVGFAKREFQPNPAPLDLFPRVLGEWDRSTDGVLDADAYAMLSPDDVLNRSYESSSGADGLSLFVAYYKTQLRAKNAHDPKVCLPGSGWEPQDSTTILLHVAEHPSGSEASTPIEANRYVIRKGDVQAVVVYWFQTYRAAVASEQTLRLHRLIDAVKESRTDMALVRIVAPVGPQGVDAATESATRFARLAYPYLRGQFPPRSAN